jgi:hypothetical protein
MDKSDAEAFIQSLQASSITQLVETARLWEDRLLVTYRCPFFLVRVGDVHASFRSSATALALYKEAQDSIESDEVFNQFVVRFEESSRGHAEAQRAQWSQGTFNQYWKPTNKILFPTLPTPPEWSANLQQRWATLPADRIQQYFRYFCIENNIVDNVFLLNSRVTIHFGFCFFFDWVKLILVCSP